MGRELAVVWPSRGLAINDRKNCVEKFTTTQIPTHIQRSGYNIQKKVSLLLHLLRFISGCQGLGTWSEEWSTKSRARLQGFTTTSNNTRVNKTIHIHHESLRRSVSHLASTALLRAVHSPRCQWLGSMEIGRNYRHGLLSWAYRTASGSNASRPNRYSRSLGSSASAKQFSTSIR